MRIMGLDYGSKTMGVALSDPLLITAQAHEIIRRPKDNHMRKTLARIEELIREYEVGEIVLGYPLNMDDSVGPRAVLSEQLADTLRRRTGLRVVLWDERLTTVEAHDIMDEAGLRASEHDEYVDKIAAALILQSYLDNRK
ncbi:MAG: Holliday junction resolvase RuvX [Lachnospiraceae bacterium]|nr:Holliday junction resolvase RuvX [Lachnospiraceae bacterium]MBQ8948118.1 Holliday junction resolvase RuvX [Lachnospiraceae bacterium]